MDLKEMGINTWNWVDSAQDRDYWRALVYGSPGSISNGAGQGMSTSGGFYYNFLEV